MKFKTNGMRALRNKANKKKGGEGKTQKTGAYGEGKPNGDIGAKGYSLISSLGPRVSFQETH